MRFQIFNQNDKADLPTSQQVKEDSRLENKWRSELTAKWTHLEEEKARLDRMESNKSTAETTRMRLRDKIQKLTAEFHASGGEGKL
jgi:predicted nuclease with TOPRIM domain